jgi:hypothetical protein
MNLYHDRNVLCDLCHHPSRFGFLYKCHQDTYIDQATQKFHQDFPDPEAIHASPIDQLRAINMSTSVIVQFEQGNVYTPAQIEQLKNQKKKMLAVLQQHQARLPVIPKCSMKCCPTCRPYLKDRVPYSFDSVFANEIEPVRPDKERLPIKNSKTMSHLGLRPTPQIPETPPSGSTSGTDGDDDDDDDDISISDCDDDDEDEEEGEEQADIDGSDGAAVTEESVEEHVPDVVEVNSVSFPLQPVDGFGIGV